MRRAVADKVELEQSVLDEFRHSPPEEFKDDRQGHCQGQSYYCRRRRFGCILNKANLRQTIIVYPFHVL